MKRSIAVLFIALIAAFGLLTAPVAVEAKKEPKVLTQQQIANRERKARLKAEEKAEKLAEKQERQRKRAERLQKRKDREDVRSFLRNKKREDTDRITIEITNLDYSCWRWQSDSDSPVFIEKHKPKVDLDAKVDRCFDDVSGYDDADFMVTYRILSAEDHGDTETAEVNRTTWEELKPGCYRATESEDNNETELHIFDSVSCR